MEKVTVEVWVIVDCDGNYSVGLDLDAAHEVYDGEYGAQGPRRVLKLAVDCPIPAEVELTGAVPAEAAPGKLSLSERGLA